MFDVVSPAVASLASADAILPMVFPFAMELVVVVLFAVIGFPIWILGRLLESAREAR